MFFISCKTAPKMPDPVREDIEYISLEPGALVYVFADVQGARPILDLVPIQELDDKQSKQMLDRTRSAVAALYPAESGRRFQLTAWGRYPGFRAGMAFGLSKGWKKQRSAAGFPYWYSGYSGLSLAMTGKQVFASASTDGNPGDPFTAPPGIEVPEGLTEFRRGALVSCWLENPGPVINRIIERMQIPLQIPAERLFVSLFSAAGEDGAAETGNRQYQGLLRIQLAGASQARALMTLFSMARAFTGGVRTGREAEGPEALAALLFANPPVQDGKNLTIKTAAMSEKEIALLFSLFSVY
jgi:hypothetical protein